MTRRTRTAAVLTMVALGLAALAALAGCKQDKSVTGDTAKQAASFYAEGFNALNGEMKDQLEDYFENIPEDGPPDFKMLGVRLTSGPFQMHMDQAHKAFAGAKKLVTDATRPMGPLADKAWDHALKFNAARGELKKYLQAEDYKDDKGAKWQTLHEQLVAEAKGYHEAMNQLADAMSAIEDVQTEDELEKLAGKRSYGYWYRFSTLQAKRFVEALDGAELDKARIAAKFAELDKGYQELTAFCTGKGAAIDAAFKAYQGSADRFYAEAKKLVRAVDEGKAPAEELGRMADAVSSSYNSLVSSHNSFAQVEQYVKN